MPPALLALALIALAVAVAVTGSSGAGAQVAPPTAPEEDRYRPPVDAPVVDPFRPPAVRWGPGNRGIEYGTEAGSLVRAIGPGTVTFAGPVAGTLHVTVTHPDGLRSSYSGVAAIRVAVGEQVRGRQVVAVSAQGFHLGVRRGDDYVDPASLWGLVVAVGPVVLVPVDEAAPGTAPTEAPPPPPLSIRAPAFIARLASWFGW